jgi:CO/xanthine dehydrogenase Mo-binding subunit
MAAALGIDPLELRRLNAIADATGHRFVDLPIRAEAIVQAAGEGV